MNDRASRRATTRKVDGVVLLDKPAGRTSNAVLQQVKRLFNARKAGHTGSLDPLATGLLPICLGQATKLSTYLLGSDKKYVARARLGVATDTGDADGEIVERCEVLPSRAEIEAVLPKFRGETKQVPPMYSALKHEGRRMYELARAGIEVEREPRPINVHALELLDVEDDEFALRVHCSKGTYIRTLVEDIAIAAGSRAHVVALRRLGAGPYAEADMVTLGELTELAERGTEALDAVLQPLDSALSAWPAVELSADCAYYLQNGQPVSVAGAPREGQLRLYTQDRRFLGIGEVIPDGRIAPRRLFRR